jgi:hypothetical protein
MNEAICFCSIDSKGTAMLKKNLLSLFIANVFLLIFVPLSQAFVGLCCAHCGGNMPLNIPGGGIPETHEFRFKLSQMYMEMGPLRDGTSDLKTSNLLGVPNNTTLFAAVPEEMRTYMTMGSVAYSFTDDFAAMGMLGYVRNDMDMKFNSALTTAAGGRDGFTMFSDGITDLTLLGKYRLYKDDNLAPTKQASLVFGVSVPPFRMQTGSGTFDPILGLTLQASSDPWWYGLNFKWEGHVYDNDQGYHRGQELRYDAYLMRQVHPRVVLLTELNYWYEGKYSDEPFAQRINGEGHLGFNPNNAFISPLNDPRNYGGHQFAVSFGFQFQPIPLHIIELIATLPVYQDLNGPQLRQDYMIQATYYVELPTKKSRRYKGFQPPKELGF